MSVPVKLRAAEALALYAEGLSLREVGRRLGCSGETVGRVLHARGVRMRAQGGERADRQARARDLKQRLD